MWKEYNSHRIFWCTNMAADSLFCTQIWLPWHHVKMIFFLLTVLIERLSITFTSNGKCEFVPNDQVSIPFTCRLLFIISTHKLLVSCNLLSIRIFLVVFICSFSILRNCQLESNVCRLPNLSNDREKKLGELMKWWPKGKWFDLLPNLEQMIEISLYVDTGS